MQVTVALIHSYIVKESRFGLSLELGKLCDMLILKV